MNVVNFLNVVNVVNFMNVVNEVNVRIWIITLIAGYSYFCV